MMSTDQLYSTANWIQASKNLERSLQAVKNPHPMPHSSTGISVSLFDDSEPVQGSHATPMKGQAFQALLSPPPKASPFSMLTSSAEMRGQQEDTTRAMREAHASLASAPVYSHALHALSTTTPLKPTPANVDAMDVDDDSAMLRTPVTGEPSHSFVSPSPMSLQVIPSPANVPGASAASGAKFASIAGDVPSSTAEEDSSHPSLTGSSPLPKSMREIYKISNENRRKKKKVKTGAASSSAAAKDSGMDGDDDDGGSASGSAHNSRPGSSAGTRKEGAGGKKGYSNNSSTGADPASGDGQSSHEFMKNIGWGSGSSPHLTSVPQTQPNSAGPYDSKRKHSSAPPSGSVSLSSSPPLSSPSFQSFDYTHATLPASNPQSQAYFSPYQDMGRDKLELQAAAGVTGPTTVANKIFKGHNMLKSQNKSVTVAFDGQRQRGGSAGSGLPAPRQPNHRR